MANKHTRKYTGNDDVDDDDEDEERIKMEWELRLQMFEMIAAYSKSKVNTIHESQILNKRPSIILWIAIDIQPYAQ